MRPNILKETGIRKIRTIRIQFSVVGKNGQTIEKMSPVEIEKDIAHRRFVATKQAVSEGSLVEIHPYTFNEHEYLGEILSAFEKSLKEKHWL